MSEDTADKVKRTFKGLFAVIDIVRQVFVGVINAVGMLLDPVGSLGGGILTITATIGDLLVGLNKFIKKTNIISGAFYAIGKVVGWVVKAIGNLLSFIGEAFSGGPAQAILDFLDRLSFDVSDAFDGMGDSIKNSSFYKMLMAIGTVIKSIAKATINLLGDALDTVFGALGSGNFADFIDTLVGGGLGVAIGKLIWDISERIKVVTDIVGSISDILDGVADALTAFKNAINAQTILTIANALLRLAIALIALSLINKDKLSDGLAVITMLMTELVIAMRLMGTAGKVHTLGLLGIANALLLLVIPLVILGKMKWETITQGLIAMTGVLAVVTAALFVLSKIKANGVLRHISLLSAIAFALVLLSIPLAIIGNMDWMTIENGLLGILGLLSIVSAVLFALRFIKTNGVLKHISLLSAVAAALILLSIPMKLIGTMEWDSWARGLIGIGVLLASMVVTLGVLSKIKTNGVLRQVTLLYQIALALIMLSIPMKLIGTMEWDSWARGLIGITVLLAAMVGTMALLSKVKMNGVLKNITTMIALCGSLALLAVSVRILGEMDWDSYVQGVLGVAVLMSGLLIAMELMAKISAFYGPTTMINATTSILLMSAALLLLIVPLKQLAKLDTDKMWQAILGLAVIMAGLTVILAGLAAISNTYTVGIMTGVGAILLMSTAVVMLVPPLLLLATVPLMFIAKSLLAIVAVFATLGVAGYFLAGVAPVIMSLAASLYAIGLGMLAAGAGTIMFGAGLSLVASGIIAVAGAVAILLKALASAALSLKVVTAAIVEGVILGIGKGLIALLSVIADAIPAIGKILIQIVYTVCDILVSCIPVIVDTVLQILSSLLDSLVSFAPKIVSSLFELILAVMDGLVNYIGPIVDRIFDFIIGIIDAVAENLTPLAESLANLGMSIIKAILSMLSLMDTSGLFDALLNVGIMLDICLGLAALSVVAPLAMIGIIAFGGLITELAAVLAILGGISRIPGLKDIIADGGDFLQCIGTAIGQFIGGIIGGLESGIASSLPSIGKSLSGFMENLTTFIEGAKGIDQTALTGVENLVKMILMLTGTALLEALLSGILGGGSIEKFVTDILLLGTGLKRFSDIMSEVSPENIDVGANALASLSAVAESLPKSGGIIQLVTGEHDLTKFAAQLPLLGMGLVGFSRAVTGINPTVVTAAASALKSLADMTAAIPNAGGIISWFTGSDEAQISMWSAKLPMLGAGLRGFSNAVNGVNVEAVTAAANAAKALAEMTSVIPDSGGMIAWFTGDSSVAKFANELCILGIGLRNFATATSGMSVDSVTGAAEAAKALAEMTTYIPTQGGMVSWFTGESSVSKFAHELPKVGMGLAGFASWMTEDVATKAKSGAEAAKALAEMTQSIPKEGGIKAWFTGETSISKFADKLPGLGEGLKGFSDSVAGVNPENITAAANAAKALAEMTDTVPKKTDKIITFGENLSSFGGHLASYFSKTAAVTAESANTMVSVVDACGKFASLDAEAISNGATSLTKLIKAIKSASEITGESVDGFTSALKKIAKISVDSIVESFDKLADKMKTVGKEAIKALASSLTDNTDTAKKAAKKVVTACADAMDEKTGSFETAGKNLVQGFADGISENTYIATAKAKAMAKAAAEAAKEALDINSPSKVFREIGSSVPEGFAQGVGKFGNVITASVEDMSGVAIDGVRDSLKRVADIVNDESYTQPTIRPVLDLSGVEYGVGQLNGMFGGNRSIALMTNVGAINTGMSHRGQNGNFNDVVKSVDKLGAKLDNVGNTTYVVEGVTYDDGSNVASAVETLIHAAKVDRRT